MTEHGERDLATVFVGILEDGEPVEFVESVQPPIPMHEKWVLIISTLRGCPVRCPMCDAGRTYAGRLSREEMLDQIDHLVERRFPDRCVPAKKFKIQFARMGDPAFNPEVLDVLRELPDRYRAPGLMPSISTIAPAECEGFLEEIGRIKDDLYSGGSFQMQFSIHSTSTEARAKLIPCRTMTMQGISRWGQDHYREGDRKISLNFAAVKGFPIDPEVVADTFPTESFMIKLTPVNPTLSSVKNSLTGIIDPSRPDTADELVEGFTELGFDTVLSIGETRENRIGSNCGMYVGSAAGYYTV